MCVSDTVEAFQAMRAERQSRGQANRNRAVGDFEAARELAQRHGLALVQYSDTHYALIRYANGKARWRHYIYPGNQRICMDRQMPKKAPYLKLPEDDWTLIDVVKAAIEATKE
jgi:hypothetical protein